jgi:hypothetical protein
MFFAWQFAFLLLHLYTLPDERSVLKFTGTTPCLSQVQDPILLSHMTLPPTWRTRFPHLYSPETGWPSYNPEHWVPCLLPPMTRRVYGACVLTCLHMWMIPSTSKFCFLSAEASRTLLNGRWCCRARWWLASISLCPAGRLVNRTSDLLWESSVSSS